jgi:hypothetical protein
MLDVFGFRDATGKRDSSVKQVLEAKAVVGQAIGFCRLKNLTKLARSRPRTDGPHKPMARPTVCSFAVGQTIGFCRLSGPPERRAT